MKNLISLYILILSFNKMNFNAIFPSTQPTKEETACINNRNPSMESCTSMATSDSQYTCCYVKGVGLSRCCYIEDTEFGIEAYENVYSDYDDVTIECKGNYLRNILFLFFLFFILYI